MFHLLVVLMVSATALTGCGSNNDNNNAPAPAPLGAPNNNIPNYNNNNCSPGMVYSPQYGCLSQGNCPMGSALYNGQCVPISGGVPGGIPGGSCNAGQVYTIQYGCLPQDNCPMGYGNYNGQCIPGVTQPNNPGYPNYPGQPGYPQCPTYPNCPGQPGYPTQPGYPGNPGYPVTCGTNYGFHHQHGCLPVNSYCPQNYGYYNGQCLPVIIIVSGGSWYGGNFYNYGTCPTGFSWFGSFCSVRWYGYDLGSRCRIRNRGIFTFWSCY